ncbi:glycoside hydrolase [Achlya hypogyna]|uniref:Glycoside hydrolase n=1 Tax=Achlya hypogyna TaxID=1202772 RepID=A0A1V9YPF5_ACHHY|nr:glycoside hydrolase [Achlya hypogyna]
MRLSLLLILVLGLVYQALSGKLPPIVARGNRLYNVATGERFIIRGITYEGDVSDDYYDVFVRETIETTLTSMFGHFNTFRLYNINPDKSYAKFMAHMDERGIYVLPSASPTNDPYYGTKYNTQTMDRSVNAEGTFSAIDGTVTPLATKTKTCYPAYLLYYGKMVIKNFAAYDNTLAIVVANEVLQIDLTAAACLKMYVADLKDWMGMNVKKMRKIPIAYAAADGAYNDGVPRKQVLDSNAYHVTKIQGLLCGDTMKNGTTTKSIDIYMINEYRWCAGNGFAVWETLLKLGQGVPIVLALGEFGCAKPKPRTWEMVPYLFSTGDASKGFTDSFSGGFAYSFGEACLPLDTPFALFTGAANNKISTKPGTKAGADYTNLLAQYKKVAPPLAKSEFSSAQACAYVPPMLQTPKMPNAIASTWMPKCTDPLLKLRPKLDNWITSSRQGVQCDASGAPCEVDVDGPIGTTQESLCGTTLEVASGGSLCVPGDSTCKHGICEATSEDRGHCVCFNCWGGSTCAAKNDEVCSAIGSSKTAPKVIFTVLAAFVGAMTLAFGALAVVACRDKNHFSSTVPPPHAGI